MTVAREKVRFPSGDSDCAAWHHPSANGACVVMAAGLAVAKEPGTDRLAERFAEAGFGVLAFDYRHLGESGGEPRQVIRIREQLEDWQSAIRCARGLPGVNPAQVAIWGFSVSGGHVFNVAARTPDLAAAISHSGLGDGLVGFRNARRHTTPGAMVRLAARALGDLVAQALGREPLTVPLAAPRGTVASLNTPDALNGAEALNPGNRYPDWRQEIAASSALRIAFYRPARIAARIEVPLLVLAYQHDGVSLPAPVIKAARLAPHGELVTLPGGHYATFTDDFERPVETMLAFLDRHAVQPFARSTPT